MAFAVIETEDRGICFYSAQVSPAAKAAGLYGIFPEVTGAKVAYMITDTLLEKAVRSGDGDEYLVYWLHAARHPEDEDAMEFVRGQDALVDTGTWPWLAQRVMILAGVSADSLMAATPPSTYSAQTLIRLFNQYEITTADALFYTVHVASNTS